MRRFATLALVLGLVGGLLGMVAFSGLSGRAGAAGAVTEQAEVVFRTALLHAAAPVELGYTTTYDVTTIDTTKFPPGTTFTFKVTTLEEGAETHCLRLAEVTPPNITINPISGSEVCTSGSPYDEWVALESGPLTLPSGDHIYMFQWKQVTGVGSFSTGLVRVAAEWTDYDPSVGGIAVLPDLADSPAHNYAVAGLLAFVAVVAFAAGGWYARRRWLT